MSTTSRQRSVKRPSPNARKDLRQHAAKHAASGDIAGLNVTAVEAMPGHANKPLIPGIKLGGMTLPKPATKGAFGGVTKPLRAARREERELAAKMAFTA